MDIPPVARAAFFGILEQHTVASAPETSEANVAIEIPSERVELNYDQVLLHVSVRRVFVFFILAASIVVLVSTGVSAYVGTRPPLPIRVGSSFDAPTIEETAQSLAATIGHDVYQDLVDMAQARKEGRVNQGLLKRAFTGIALDQLVSEIAGDQQMGRIKIEVIQDLKVSVGEVQGDGARATLTFVDQGYYVDSETKQMIQKPAPTSKKLAASVVKDGDRWKIDNLYASP